MRWWALLLVLLAACAPEALKLEVEAVSGGIEISANAPLERVELLDDAGVVVARRVLPAPADRVHLSAPWAPDSRYTVRAHTRARAAAAPFDTPPRTAVRIEVEAPVGQGRRTVGDGEVVAVTLVEGAAVEVGLVLTAVEPTRARIEWPSGFEEVALPVAGTRHVARTTLTAAVDAPIRVVVGGSLVQFTLRPQVVSEAEAREALVVLENRVPAEIDGSPDRARPEDRITLPAGWWGEVLRWAGMGYRPLDDQAPWSWQAVVLENRSSEPLNVVVRSQVVEASGAPVPAFRSRIREADSPGGAVSVLLTVPAGDRATATLPLYVESRAITPGTYTRIIEVTPLGAGEPLHELRRPLYVTRGSAWTSGGFLASLIASLTGLVVLARYGGHWLRSATTAELMTIALFGSLTFVVAAASQLLGYGVSALLGPFAPLITGIVDDAFRTCLLAALIVLIPRVGVVTLASLVGYLMRGLAMGSFHPVDLLYFGSVVCFLEGCLWLSGLTRDPSWREQGRLARWLRLSAGFATANTLALASGLVVTVVLYRLFLADWYVALMLLLPGFAYVVLGCWLAVDFSASLRKVES